MNIKNIRNKAYVMAHGINRKKLYKSGKLWLVGSATLLALMGGANAISHQSVHAANVDQPNVTAHAKTSQIKANPQASNSAYTVKSSVPSSVASQSNNNNNFQIKSIATNNVSNSNIQSSANDLHSKLINSKVASALVGNNSGENSTRIFSNEPSNLKISSNKLGSATNSDSNASTPNYIEDNAHYNLGSYNARQPQSTEVQSNVYQAYLKANPQLANLYNETANQSSSNSVDNSSIASNAPKDNVSASSVASNSSASSVSANNSKVSSANQISDKKNKPLIKTALTSPRPQLKATNNIISGKWYKANWDYNTNTGNLYIHDGMLGYTPNDLSIPNLNRNLVKSITTSNVQINTDGGPTAYWDGQRNGLYWTAGYNLFAHFSDVQSIDLSGITNSSDIYSFGAMFFGDTNLKKVNFGNNFNDINAFDNRTSDDTKQKGQTGVSGMFEACPNLKELDFGPNFKMSNAEFDWSGGAHSAIFGSAKDNDDNIATLTDGNNHAGSWTIRYGQVGNWKDNNTQGNPATWAFDSNSGTLYLANGEIDNNTNGYGIPWSSVKSVHRYNVQVVGNDANFLDEVANTVNDRNRTKDINNNQFIKNDTNASNAVSNDDNIISTATSAVLNGSNVSAEASMADSAYSDASNQVETATESAFDSLAGKETADSTSASVSATSAEQKADDTINADINSINSLTNNNTKLSQEVSYANSVAQSDVSAVNSWKASSQAIATSLADAIIKSGQTNSAYISNLEAKSTATSQALDRANASLTSDATSISDLKNELASVSSSASSASASATNNSNWIANHSGSLASAYSWAKSASASATNALTSLSTDQTYINWLNSSETALSSGASQATSNQNWIKANSASVSNLSQSFTDVYNKIKQDSTALSQAIGSKADTSDLTNKYNALSGDITNASSLANTADTLAKGNQSWIHNNSASLSSASTEASEASTSAKTNATNISNLSGKVKTDEKSLSSASTSASSVAKWLTSDSATLSSASNSAQSAYNYYTTNSASISNAIKEASNTSLAQSSFNTAYTNASKAESWINSNSGSFSTLSGSISTLSGKVDADKQNLDNAIATKANASDISDYITVLDHDISINNSLVNQANKLANDNSNAINNLKANTAITLTFIKNGQLFGTPTTLTNSYIEQNATPETGTTQGQPGTYNVTSLLENSLPSGYNISNAYTVTIGSNENGTATMDLGNGDKKFALGATRDNSNDMNTLTLGTPSQQARAWNYVQNGINYNDFAPLSKVGTNYPYISNTDKAKNNPIDVSGNPVDYNGNITLNFVDNNNHQIKSITVPYNVNSAVGNTVNLLENATNGNPNVSDATKYLNQTIQGFDTHNFSYDSGNQQKDYSFEIPVSDNSGHTTTVAKKKRDLTFTFKANNETETINYIDEATNKNVGTGSVNGADDTQGVVTSKNANNLPKDYQIINNAPFTFTPNGSVNVLVAKKGTENKDNSNDTHSNVPNAKPTDVAHTFTVTVNDHYNSDGKQQTKTYQKYVVEKGAEGSKFTVNPSDYTTYGYNMNASDKPVTGTITNNGLSTNGITWSFTAKKASSDNNSGNYKPSDVTPNNVTPSDLTKNPSANNPQNKNNVDNAKHGYATLYLVERINGQNHNVTVRTINENNLDTTANYDIKASDYTPTGYKTTSSDNDLTGHIKTDGSLSNGTATFYYDVNASDIAPISITDINQDGDYVNANTGSDLGKSDTNNEATYTIGSKYLSTLGALGDYVNITNLLQAPNGYHLNNVNNAVSTNGTALNHIQLTKPTGVSLSNPLGAMKFVLTLPSRYTPKQEMTSEASEVQSDVGSATNWANNTSLSDSTRKSINSDIHSMNDDNAAIRQHITGGTNGSKAARPFYSNASSAYANASVMANSGILSASTKARSQAESADAMNAKSASASSANPISNLVITGSTGAKSQSNSANHQSSNSQWIPRNPISDKSHHSLKNVSRKGLINLRFGTLAKYNGYKVSRVSLKGIRYFKVYKAILLHTDPMSVGRARNYKGRITPRMRLTLTVTKAFKLVRNHHTYYRFLLNFNHHDYFITANPKFVRNAYLPLTHRMNHRHVHVFRTVFEYKHVDHDMKLVLRKGHTVKIRRIKKLGKYNRTRVQLSNGNWITANLNFISVI